MSNVAETTMTTERWVNRFGELTEVERATARNGKPMVRATIRSINKDGAAFTTKMTAFNEKVRKELLEKGIGAFVSLRGPLKKVPMDGGKYTVEIFEPAMVNTSKVKREDSGAGAQTQPSAHEDTGVDQVVESSVEVPETVEAAPVETALPALPEGASEETHALYTKRDGTKAWRKRPAARATEPAAAEEAQAKAEVESAVEPAQVGAVASTISEVVAEDAAPDTAMAAAFREAFGLRAK